MSDSEMRSLGIAGSVAQLLTMATTGRKLIGSTQFWYRGQPDSSKSLKPKIFRDDAPTTEEAFLCHRFKLEATSRYERCPSTEGHEADFNWLCLMQHYGLPTRLLDWTESILVAAHFALQGHDDSDAAIYMLSPEWLNQAQSKNPIVGIPGDERVRALARNAFALLQEEEQHLAVIPNSLDPRMLVQRSRFTIHGTPSALEEVAKESMLRCTIPMKSRRILREELIAAGITEGSLFPDLVTLAKDLTSEAMCRVQAREAWQNEQGDELVATSR